MTCPESPAATEARTLLGQTHFDAVVVRRLVKSLQKESRFDLARGLLVKIRETGEADPWFRRQQAVCTYKDEDLPLARRLDQALEVLRDGEDLRTTTSQEALGIAGAIFKRKWEVDTQKGHLERALVYYRRGYEQGIAGPTADGELDEGYTAINTAFLLDLLADVEIREAASAGAASDAAADSRRREARRIREDIVQTLGTYLEDRKRWNWWNVATMGEACLGTGRYQGAARWLQRGRDLEDTMEWQVESSVRQLATLARLQMPAGSDAHAFEKSEPGRVLHAFLGRQHVGVMSGFVGKVGLALSGGGFRASFFHLGVLAKLAELDVLRHVEVLSCVSGGAILGADYYLRVRELLQRKADADVTREDYIDIVQAMTTDFLEGVQRNVRTRAVVNPLVNLKMSGVAYTRSHRMGELLEREIYARVPDGEGDGPRYLDELLVRPVGEPDGFRPKRHNWRRRAKVPILILNATTLNTGHNWQFTATWMGESPAAIDPAVDGVEQLRRMYYCDAQPPNDKMRLGYAVAASACVPGLFAPLTLEGLYPDRTVRLVDGGVHDNQGEVGLLEQDCAAALVSDAGGQLLASARPGEGILSVLGRSQGVQNSRIREAQFDDLRARRASGLLRNFMYVHLKMDLGSPPVDCIKCPKPVEDPPEDSGPVTTYGINKRIQTLVSGIRTDLDSFGEAEAHALMLSGYRTTGEEFARSISGVPVSGDPGPAWSFLDLEDAMGADPPHADLERVLRTGQRRALKIWSLSPVLRVAGAVLTLAVLAALALAVWRWRDVRLLRVGWIGWTLFVLAVGAIGGKVAREIVQWVRRKRLGALTSTVAPVRDRVVRWVQSLALAIVGAAVAWIHLTFFDPWFIRRERVRRVLR
jgi:predicted acylesterase/phospholipase RssA